MQRITFFAAMFVALAGCQGYGVPLGALGVVTIHSNPTANALRTCAMMADLLTPGVSPAAAAEVGRSALRESLALGATPAGAMRRCAKMLDDIDD